MLAADQDWQIWVTQHGPAYWVTEWTARSLTRHTISWSGARRFKGGGRTGRHARATQSDRSCRVRASATASMRLATPSRRKMLLV